MPRCDRVVLRECERCPTDRDVPSGRHNDEASGTDLRNEPPRFGERPRFVGTLPLPWAGRGAEVVSAP